MSTSNVPLFRRKRLTRSEHEAAVDQLAEDSLEAKLSDPEKVPKLKSPVPPR